MLEVGCGTGFVLQSIAERYPAARLTGTELFEEGLTYARARVPSGRFVQLDATAMTEAATYDVVGAFDVLEHIVDDTSVLDGIYRALRPGGIVIATVPQHPRLWSRQDETARHVRRYAHGELEAKARHVGLQIVRSTSFVSLLLPAMVASRRRPGASAETVDDLRQPATLDRLLGMAMALERAAIRAGASFPAGGSRLVVARRASETS